MATGDYDDPIDYGSIVRNNLMKRPFYAPYCSGFKRTGPSDDDFTETSCVSRFLRMVWYDHIGQFACVCGCQTEFPQDFIEQYKPRRLFLQHMKED